MHGTKERFEELLQKIHTRASACKTLGEARVLWSRTPSGSSAWEVCQAHCRELAMVDVLAKNTSCEDELREWRNTAPVFALGSEEIERIYRCRLDEILYPDAVVEAATCKTVGDIEGLLEKTNLFYAGKRKIYGERRKELIIADAVIKASTRTSSEQAKFLRFSNGYGISEVDEVYRNRWIELANAEAPAKAATCKTVGEAEKLFYDAPNGSEAKMIYEYRCMELF